MRKGPPNRTHREGDHIHGSASHTTWESILNFILQCFRRHPLSELALYPLCWCRNCVRLFVGNNKSLPLHSSNILWVGASQPAVIILRQVLNHAHLLHGIE